MSLTLLLACSASDGQLYAMSAEADSLERASAYCSDIRSQGLRAECLGQLGREHPDDLDIEAHCASIDDPQWRDECTFLLAEERWDAQRADDAIGLCKQAGRYLGQCFMHLWADHAAGLKREKSPEEAIAGFEEALTWPAEHLDEDLERRGWGLYFRTEVGTVDLTHCSGEKARLCRAGLREAITRAINRHAARGGSLPCAAKDAEARAEALKPLIAYVPTPSLDTWVQSALGQHCS